MKKDKFRRITVAEMAPHIHSFKINENKVEKIFNWLENWIVLSLECGKIQPYDLLPLKSDLACHIGVSQGTIQNVFRLLEDKSYVESKQRVGTFIKKRNSKGRLEKLTSKREFSISIIKKYLLDNYKIGDKLISIRKLSQITGITNATLRTAVINLVQEKILIKKERDFYINNLGFDIEKIEAQTLVEKISILIKSFIESELKAGDRLPTNSELVKMYNVSIKTIHDALKILTKSGLIATKRGKYGSFVVSSEIVDVEYIYEKIEHRIREYIYKNCQIGDKLPTIRDFSKMYGVSEKTIKKSLDNLKEDGFITFIRGRYGGTFVTDIPQEIKEAYKWLAINMDYIQN